MTDDATTLQRAGAAASAPSVPASQMERPLIWATRVLRHAGPLIGIVAKAPLRPRRWEAVR